MIKVDCNKYKGLENCDMYEYSSRENKECNYCGFKEEIEWKLYERVWDLFLTDFIVFIWAKWRLEWKDIQKISDEEILPSALDLIWNLLKERKVKAEIYGIEEYEEPREIEKVMFGGKLRKKYITNWIWKHNWYINPCEIKDEKELEEKVEEWKRKTFELYKYVLEKYGKEKAEWMLNWLVVERSECYEWEIVID